MDELTARLMDKVGVSEQTARAAIEMVLAFLSREAPPAAIAELVAAIPDLKGELQMPPDEAAFPAATGHFGGMARLMRIADQMMEAGMTMPQVQDATREVVAFAREKAGSDLVDRIVAAVPGLRQVA
ncbi:DUF2267 domain-containing protein [Roseixanthobacter glucoisosaccharinicivorans]|uniref:DUF2267 domain-containing protein n=1 Tax=Roseixanthobacter glucoisosaccharinicivorans TaxID=3119923 RepID=UPI003728FAC6